MEHADYISCLRAGDLAGAQAYLRRFPQAANAVDASGTPAIFAAVESGNLPLCRYLIEHSLTKIDLLDAHGAGLLHHAAVSGGVELVRYLTETVGFDPLSSDATSRTPFSIARDAANSPVLAYFEEKLGFEIQQSYQNPVLPGFHPDPSVVRVGEDYYLVNSSFTYFPAIPIHHSRDLVHWELIGHAIVSPTDARLERLASGRGYWAPDISYHDGKFYITATLRRNDDNPRPRAQMITWAEQPQGPYAPPVFIEEDGIDPSLFTDVDGKRYMLLNRGARLLPLSDDATRVIAPAQLLWYGSNRKATEGPHLIHKDGWYYLFVAEGGTGLTHQVNVGRSRTLTGPYTPCPYNPILQQQDLSHPLQKAGHAKPVQTQNGQWYVTYLLSRPQEGYSPLGRETGLDAMTWTADGWPIVNDRKGPSVLQQCPNLTRFTPQPPSLDPAAPGSRWVGRRVLPMAKWSGETLFLQADARELTDPDSRAVLLTRQQSLHTLFSACVMRPEQGAVGLCCYYDEASFCQLRVTRESLSVVVQEGAQSRILQSLALADAPPQLWLQIRMQRLTVTFSTSKDGEAWEQCAQIPKATFLCDEGLSDQKRFTGNMLGLFAVGQAYTAQFSQIVLTDWAQTEG